MSGDEAGGPSGRLVEGGQALSSFTPPAGAATGASGRLVEHVQALTRDTVAPRVTLERIVLLLRTRLPGALACAIRLSQPGEPEPLVVGESRSGIEGETITVAIAGQRETYGTLEVVKAFGQKASPDERQALERIALLLAPIARLALGLEVPRNPRPEA
jgi:hypothetical protein